MTYGDVFHQNEVEQSTYNFEHADVGAACCRSSTRTSAPAGACSRTELALPAYEQMIEGLAHASICSTRARAISVTERQRYILRVRTLARGVAEAIRTAARHSASRC